MRSSGNIFSRIEIPVARFTLKTFYGVEQLECFTHRSGDKLRSILSHSSYDRAGQTGPFGEIIKHPDKFEVFDSVMEKIFQGNIKETLVFIRNI